MIDQINLEIEPVSGLCPALVQLRWRKINDRLYHYVISHTRKNSSDWKVHQHYFGQTHENVELLVDTMKGYSDYDFDFKLMDHSSRSCSKKFTVRIYCQFVENMPFNLRNKLEQYRWLLKEWMFLKGENHDEKEKKKFEFYNH